VAQAGKPTVAPHFVEYAPCLLEFF